MRTYRTQFLTTAIPTWAPDDAPAAPPAAAPPAAAPPAAAPPAAAPQVPTPELPAPPATPPEPPKQDATPPADPPKPEDNPAVPETYELKVSGADGKDIDLDPEAVKAATPIFKAAGLTNEQAQAVVSHYAKDVLPGVAQTIQADTLKLLGLDGMASWAGALKTDKEFGGADYEKNLTIIAAGRDKFASEGLRAVLETSRLGNHPEMVRLFYNLGKLTQEGSVIPPAAGQREMTAQSFYDPAFSPKT